MKQFLRSLWTLLLLMMWCSVGFAQTTVTFDATKDKSSTTTLTKDGVTLKIGGGVLDNGTDFRCYSKKGFTITSNEDITKIEFTCIGNGTKNYGPGKINNPSTGKYTYSGYIGTWTGLTKSVKFSNSAQVQMKKIVVTLASSKTPTTLAFLKSTINIEEGNEATFTGQTATLKTGETELYNAITYTTNNDDMFEAYETNVGPKALKAGAYGTAVVTAKFNGDDTYKASTATYTVNYTEKAKPATTLDFGFATKTVNIDETFTATAALKAGETAISGAVTYTSSKSEVATVNETTGEVSALTAGKTTITATFAGTSEYKSSTASYDLTVVDPNLVVLDATTDKGTISTDQGQNDAIEKGNIVLKGYNIALNAKNTSYYKIYSKGYFTISAKEGIITKIAINCTGSDTNDYGPGHLSSDTEGYSYAGKVGTWEGNATSVKITNTDTKQVRIKSIEITVKNKVITLDENLNNTFSEEKGVTVKTVRTLVANKWNTFCVPFDTEIAGTALDGATIKAVGTIEGNVINLVEADKIEAGVPYLVMPTTESIVNPTFKGVTISVTTPVGKGNDEYKFVGTYSPKKITEDEFGKIWGVTAEGKLAKINEGTTMKGLRAYFVFPTNTAAAKLNFDGETTGINNIETNATVNGKVYNLNGQYVGNSLNGLKKGIYVVNGKKVIK